MQRLHGLSPQSTDAQLIAFAHAQLRGKYALSGVLVPLATTRPGEPDEARVDLSCDPPRVTRLRSARR